MKSILLIVHIMISITMISLVLLQSSKGGLGSAFGGSEGYRTKRGAERVVFVMTIVFSVLFLISSVTTFIVR